uniref:Natural killer cell receptor 2B4 immunoglobulin domain-containing protein n=1 Tax=Athene cunicularia TaxID=194338 RepID=A0A663M1P5_ATHCN
RWNYWEKLSLFFFKKKLRCREQAVSAGETLRHLPEKPPQGWEKVDWRVRLNSGHKIRILTTEKNQAVQFSKSPFSGRAGFHPDTLSLWISAVGTADSGVYEVEFEDTSGSVTAQCSVPAEPVRSPHLEQNLLHREQGWCNLLLVCAVPGASNVSYSWTCSGDPLGDPEPRPWVHLHVRDDDNLTVCSCNASNPVSWSVASTDVTPERSSGRHPRPRPAVAIPFPRHSFGCWVGPPKVSLCIKSGLKNSLTNELLTALEHGLKKNLLLFFFPPSIMY